MECPDFMELISVRQDGELTPAEEKRLNDHLAVCADCRQFRKELINLKQTMAVAAMENMPRETEHKIVKETVHKVSVISRIFGAPGEYYRIPRGVVWATVIILMSLLGNTIAGRLNAGSKAAITREHLSESVMIQQVELTKGDLVEVQTFSAQGLRH